MINIRLNNKGQNTAEYALLIALVIAGIIAMQTYAQRSLQARVKDASRYMSTNTATDGAGQEVLGSVQQYEPYYLKSDYEVNRRSEEQQLLGNTTTASYSITNREREAGGYQESGYQGGDNQL